MDSFLIAKIILAALKELVITHYLTLLAGLIGGIIFFWRLSKA